MKTINTVAFATSLAVTSISTVQAKENDESIDSALEVITVTAERREDQAFNVPISLQAFDQETIELYNYENTNELIFAVPNAYISQQRAGLGESNFSIRGVGTTTLNVDQTIGFYIDDIPVASVSEFGAEYYDIEQVEVLRGPEGTLYGRNALGGVLHIKTRQPDEEQNLKTVLSYGSDNEKRIALVANTPLVEDKINARVNFLHASHDPRINNFSSVGQDVDELNVNAARTKLSYQVNDKLQFLFAGDISDSEQTIATGDFATIGIKSVSSVRPALLNIENKGVSVKAEYLFDNSKLTSLSSIRWQDLDGRGGRPELQNFNAAVPQLAVFNNDFTGKLDQSTATQEIRLSSTNDDKLSWIVGAFFQYNDAKRISDVINVSTNIFERSFADTKDSSTAVFGDVSYQLNELWSMSVGVRASHSKKELDYRHQGSFAPLFGFNFAPNQQLDLEQSFNDLSPRVVLEYQPDSHYNLYAKVAKGFKAGGYNTEFVGALNVPYGKESIINYETGIKSRLFDRRLEADLSLFYMDWSDQQVLVFERGISQVANANKSRSQGLELQLRARLIEPLLITAAAAYVDASFEETPTSLSVKGNRQPNTPKSSASLSGRYHTHLTDEFELFIGGNVAYQSSFYWDVANTLKEPDHTFVNVSIGIESDHYEISLFGKNITDEAYRVFAIPGTQGFFNAQAQPGFGRELGIKAVFTF